MKITKQRLKEIIKEELSNVLTKMNKNDYHAVRLRLQVEYGVDDASGELIEDVYRISPDFATEAVEVKPEIDQAIKMAIIEDDAAAESVPAMSLEEAAPWDPKALKEKYPRDYKRHAIIDQEHAYGASFDDVMKKLDHRPGASTREKQGRWTY